MTKTPAVPKVGDELYVGNPLSHPTYCGGLARVAQVVPRVCSGKEFHFLIFEELPGREWNWEAHLALCQERWQKQFGQQRLGPDPAFDKPRSGS